MASISMTVYKEMDDINQFNSMIFGKALKSIFRCILQLKMLEIRFISLEVETNLAIGVRIMSH